MDETKRPEITIEEDPRTGGMTIRASDGRTGTVDAQDLWVRMAESGRSLSSVDGVITMTSPEDRAWLESHLNPLRSDQTVDMPGPDAGHRYAGQTVYWSDPETGEEGEPYPIEEVRTTGLGVEVRPTPPPYRHVTEWMAWPPLPRHWAGRIVHVWDHPKPEGVRCRAYSDDGRSNPPPAPLPAWLAVEAQKDRAVADRVRVHDDTRAALFAAATAFKQANPRAKVTLVIEEQWFDGFGEAP